MATRRSLLALVVSELLVSGAAQWWRGLQVQQVGRELAQLARPGDITMMSSTACVFCNRARQFMTVQQVPFTECFIETDARCAQRYQALGARGTPTLLVRGQLQLGFSASALRDWLRALPARPGA
ncbi:MAG: glutaredoxin family protein [Microbacteriaceae bacterium]|nr:glutaredoxin family protein [Burkholderiaceae bacterium]